MSDNSREAIIAKYTDKTRYKLENIFGDVYVDEARVEYSKKSDKAKEDYDRELDAAKRFSKHFNCEVFLLPNEDKNGNVIFIKKHKNPDAIIQGYFIDFKQAKGTDGSVTKQFGRGLGQAEGVIITVMDGITIDNAVQWLNGKINSMKKPHNGFIVVIEDAKGNYKTFTINAKRLSKEENLFTAVRRVSPSNKESINSQVD